MTCAGCGHSSQNVLHPCVSLLLACLPHLNRIVTFSNTSAYLEFDHMSCCFDHFFPFDCRVFHCVGIHVSDAHSHLTSWLGSCLCSPVCVVLVPSLTQCQYQGVNVCYPELDCVLKTARVSLFLGFKVPLREWIITFQPVPLMPEGTTLQIQEVVSTDVGLPFCTLKMTNPSNRL